MTSDPYPEPRGRYKRRGGLNVPVQLTLTKPTSNAVKLNLDSFIDPRNLIINFSWTSPSKGGGRRNEVNPILSTNP